MTYNLPSLFFNTRFNPCIADYSLSYETPAWPWL